MKLLVAGCLLLTAVSCQTGRPPDREYRVGYSHSPPYLIEDSQGRISGFSFELANEGARRAGMRLRWVRVEIGPEEALAAGKVDLWPLLAEFTARRDSIYVTRPFRDSFFGLAVRSNSVVRRGEEFGKRRLAHSAIPWHARTAKVISPDAELLAFPSQTMAVEALCQNRADGALLNFSELAGGDWPPADCVGLDLRILPTETPGTRVGVAAASKNAGAIRAADQLREAFDSMSEDGMLNGLSMKWFGPMSGGRLLREEFQSGRRWNLYLTIGLGLLSVALAALAYIAARYRRAKIEAEAARQQATLANGAKNDFLATLSHELRTPMNGVLGMAEALSQSGLTAGQQESIGILRRSAEALLALIDDLLDFAKLDAGRLRIDSKPFELWTVLEEAALLMEAQARQHGLDLHFRFSAGLPQMAVGDSRRLRQVVLNLVSNAVKFTPDGSITVAASVVAWRGPEARVRVAVTDTGVGIPDEKLHLLFRRFSQLDTTSTRRHGGTGLGLAIAKELVNAMGGSIGVESQRGKGSTFWFELPYPCGPAPSLAAPLVHEIPCRSETAARQASALVASWGQTEFVDVRIDQESADAFSEPIRPSMVWRKLHGVDRPASSAPAQPLQGRILLVEDNEINQRVASALLRKLGLEVEVARNGVECLERWVPARFDAILMDCTMPVMDGFEATRRIREREHTPGLRTPIIALTATALEQARLECLEAGMDDFVTKPVRRETLEPLLAQWLARRPASS